MLRRGNVYNESLEVKCALASNLHTLIKFLCNSHLLIFMLLYKIKIMFSLTADTLIGAVLIRKVKLTKTTMICVEN